MGMNLLKRKKATNSLEQQVLANPMTKMALTKTLKTKLRQQVERKKNQDLVEANKARNARAIPRGQLD